MELADLEVFLILAEELHFGRHGCTGVPFAEVSGPTVAAGPQPING